MALCPLKGLDTSILALRFIDCIKSISFMLIDIRGCNSGIIQIIYNNPVLLEPIEDQGLPINCWPHFHLTTDRSESSSSHFRDDVCSGCQIPQIFLAF